MTLKCLLVVLFVSISVPAISETKSEAAPVVNMDDPNLARGSGFVADAAASCAGAADTTTCLRAQGIQFEAELREAIKLANQPEKNPVESNSAP